MAEVDFREVINKAPLAQKIIKEVAASLKAENDMLIYRFSASTGPTAAITAAKGVIAACKLMAEKTKFDDIINEEKLEAISSGDAWILYADKQIASRGAIVLVSLREVLSDTTDTLPHSLEIDVACAAVRGLDIVRRIVLASQKADSGVHELFISPASGSVNKLMPIYTDDMGFRVHSRKKKGEMPVLYHPLVHRKADLMNLTKANLISVIKKLGEAEYAACGLEGSSDAPGPSTTPGPPNAPAASPAKITVKPFQPPGRRGLGKPALRRHRKILHLNQSDFARLTAGK
jgi:hypothetical protein